MSYENIICIASQKGGTGKTTTALNLAVCLTEFEQRVLLIDIDPQANLTTGLGIDPDNLDLTIYELLLNPEISLKSIVLSTSIHNLDIIPSTLDLAGAELELGGRIGREWLLRKGLNHLPSHYDYVILDTPPSLGLLTQNALMACNRIIVPLQVHVYAFNALAQLQKTVSLMQEFNPALNISGIVCTMYDSRNSLSKVIEETVRQEFNELVYKTVIPMNISLAEAPASGKPIIYYNAKSAAAEAYRRLAIEVLNHVEEK